MKAVLANMGFVLQISGIFLILPIILSFVNNETDATIGLFITAMAFLALGFGTNALCERKELNFKESSTLIVLVFLLLSFIGAIPYFYLTYSQGDILGSFTSSVFESASGFTTTGFSVLPNLSEVPKSIIFYRALTQFIGGIGIILLLMAFFYPEAKLVEFSRSMGFTKNQEIKKTFLSILLIYFIYSIIMIVIGLLFGYYDIINLVSFIFSALSTGGFSPVTDMTASATQFPLNIILILAMVLGAINFFILAGLFKRRFKEFLTSETTVFLVMAFVATLVVMLMFNLSAFDSVFHVISAMSTSGFSYLQIQNFNDGLKLFTIVLMFIGGASLSTAGGIKIYRFLLLFKAARKTVVDSITKRDTPVRLFGKVYTNAEVISSLALILVVISIIFVSAFIVSSYGYKPIDALFESTSALATTGLSVGIVGPSLALELKWLFILLMLLGRVEIFAFFVIMSRKKETTTPAH